MDGLNDKTFLVTGGGGFIGRHVIRALLDKKATIRALVGAPGEHNDFSFPEVEAAWAEIDNETVLSKLASDVDFVIHLAGPPSAARSFAEPERYRRIHIRGTQTVLDAAAKASVRRLVCISSAEVYGLSARNPVTEDATPAPLSPYGEAKLQAERLVKSFSRNTTISAIILRPFSVYGEGCHRGSVLGTIASQAMTNDVIQLGNLRPIRDYCHVEDVARAILCACAQPHLDSTIFNVGTGRGTSVAELARIVLSVVEKDIPISGDKTEHRAEGIDILELVADTRRAASCLGWRAKISLEEGLGAWLKPMILATA